MYGGEIVFADLVDADPAPRELTITGRRYIAGQAPYVWVVLAVLFVLLPGIVTVMFVTSANAIGSLLGGVALVVGLTVWAARKRAMLRKVLVDGTQRPAQLMDVSHLVVRRGLVSGHRVSCVIMVDGRRTTCVSWAGDLEEAEAGAWIRVLVHPGIDIVVPVVSVT